MKKLIALTSLVVVLFGAALFGGSLSYEQHPTVGSRENNTCTHACPQDRQFGRHCYEVQKNNNCKCVRKGRMYNSRR